MSEQEQEQEKSSFEDRVRGLSKDEAKFVLEQAEKKLKEISDATQLIVNRTVPVLTIVVGLIIALMGFGFSKLSGDADISNPYVLTAFITAFYLYRISRRLVSNIKAEDYKPMGLDPKILLADSFFNPEDIEDMKENRLTYFYMNEVYIIQRKIDDNNKKNEERWDVFNTSLSDVIYTPLVIAFTFVVAELVLITLNFFA